MHKRLLVNIYDYPEIYDLAFNKFTKFDVELYLNAISQYCVECKKLIDVGCGTSRLAIPLATHGFYVLGLDNNFNMVSYSRRKILSVNTSLIDVLLLDMTFFNFNSKFDVAYISLDTFRHLISLEDVKKHLKSIYLSLRDQGIYIVDMHVVKDDVKAKTLRLRKFWVSNGIQCYWTYTFKINDNTCLGKYKFKLSNGISYIGQYTFKLWYFTEFIEFVSKLGLFDLIDVKLIKCYENICRTLFILKKR